MNTKNTKILGVWGYPTNPYYDPDKAANGGGYWQYEGGIVLTHNGELVVLKLYDDSVGDFGSRWGFDVSAPGYCWRVNCGDADDASIDAPEYIDGVCASIEGVLGLDVVELIHEVAPVIDECARFYEEDKK